MLDVFDLAPKAELHLHLEGAVPSSTLWQLVEEYGDTDVTSLDALTARFEYRDFPHFIETWWWMTGFIRTEQDFATVAKAVATDLASQNLIYVEASISPADFGRHGLTVGDIATSVRSGLEQVDGVEVGLLVDLVRDTGPEACMDTLEQAIEVAGDAGIIGITIGGSEHDFPPGLFTDVYRRARDAGLGLTAHAGEAAGPASVWSALRDLGVSRIGHGVRSVEDPELVDYLVAHKIPLEVCPTSNLRTGVVESWEAHPVFELIDRGAAVTINSDDPLFFGSSVAGDLRRVADFIDLDVQKHTIYAIDGSWASDDMKHRLRSEVIRWWNAHPPS